MKTQFQKCQNSETIFQNDLPVFLNVSITVTGIFWIEI